jgi:hypothetical protein
LEEPKVPGFGKPIKVIDGALIEGEWERFVGATGMVIGANVFKSQLFKDFLSFSTTVFSGGGDTSARMHYHRSVNLMILYNIYNRALSCQREAESVHSSRCT